MVLSAWCMWAAFVLAVFAVSALDDAEDQAADVDRCIHGAEVGRCCPVDQAAVVDEFPAAPVSESELVDPGRDWCHMTPRERAAWRHGWRTGLRE